MQDKPGSYQVLLLGPPTVIGPDGPIRIPSTKAAALLWYVAARPHQAIGRAHVAALLWDTHRDAEARNNLRMVLTRLRQSLPFWPLLTSRHGVQWNPQSEVEIDAEFLSVLSRRQDRDSLAQAATLWRGPFLDGFCLPDCELYQEWMEQQREHWEQHTLWALDRLVQLDGADGDWPSVTLHAQQALQINPMQEHFHRALMLAHWQMGNRAAAMAQYAMCERVLAKELGVAPDSQTTSLSDAIAAGTLQRPDRADEPYIPLTPMESNLHGKRPRAEPPLVGRERDLSAIDLALARAVSGHERIVVLSGEAGIGKTRLVSHVMEGRAPKAAESKPFRTLLLGHCHAECRNLPYSPFVEALNQVLPSLDLPALDVSPVWLAHVSQLIPELAARSPWLPELADRDTAQGQVRLLEAVTRLLAALPRPLLLALEDLHWADEPTLTLLAYLARSPLVGEISLLVTARRNELAPGADGLLSQLQREGRLTWHEVPRLSPAAIQLLVTAMTGCPDARLGSQLNSKSGGNPLFAVELLRAFLAGQSRAKDLSLDAVSIPDTVQGVIRNRWEQLSERDRHLCGAASIFPRGVTPELLAGVAGWTEGDVVGPLETLLQMGMLVEAVDRGGPLKVAFSHDVVRLAIQFWLSQVRLQALHRRAFTLCVGMAGSTPSDAIVEQLAYHATQGGIWEQGVAWNRHAAAAAERVFGFDPAVGYLENALACLRQIPDSAETRRLAVDLRLQMARVGHFYTPARQHHWLSSAESDAAALKDTGRLKEVWLAQAHAFTVQGRMPRALALFEKLLPFARAARIPALLGPGLTFMGLAHAIMGRYDRAERLLHEALPVVDRLRLPLYTTSARTFQACIHAARGQFAQAEALVHPLVEGEDRITDPALLGHALAVAAVARHYRGWWDESAALGLEGIQRAREGNHLLHEYVASVVPGLPLARLGRVEEGLRVQQWSIALAGSIGTVIFLDLSQAWLGEIHLIAGNLDAAEAAGRNALQIAESNQFRLGAALARKVLGQVLVARGDRSGGRRALREALGILTGLCARPDAARCHAQLARLAGDPAEGAAHRSEAEITFRTLEMRWDLDQLP